MPLKVRLLLLISFALLSSGIAGGQVKVTVKVNKDYAALWNKLIISNKDTSMELSFDALKGTTVKGLKDGSWHIVLQSVFNRSVSSDIVLKKQASIQLNAENIFNKFKDTTSLLDRMREGDTAQIYYLPGGAWKDKKDYFMVVKEGSGYYLVVRNERNDWLSSKPITHEEESELRKALKYKSGAITETDVIGKYYCALGNKVLIHDCGSCIYGFILRKHLVRAP